MPCYCPLEGFYVGIEHEGKRIELPLPLALLKVVCPSTQKTYFLRVEPDVENAKQALESTLPGYTRDWNRDLVAETLFLVAVTD